MLPRLVFDLAARVLPQYGSGAALHLRALDAAARGDLAAAERWFERAAERYRHELAVEPLARLRVHQLMTRARAGAGGDTDLVEIVRLLNRLDRLETLESPHELADARSVLAEWIEAHEGEGASSGPLLTTVSRAA